MRMYNEVELKYNHKLRMFQILKFFSDIIVACSLSNKFHGGE